MSKKDHLMAWVNHAALNAGAGLRCAWHCLLPPQVDHQAEDVQLLSKSNPATEFLIGIGAAERRD